MPPRLSETTRTDTLAIAATVVGVLLLGLGRLLRAVDDNLAELPDT